MPARPLSRSAYAGGTGSHISISCVVNCVRTVLRSGINLKTTRSSLGRPRKYNGSGTISTESERFQLTYLNGPIPTGRSLYGAVLIFVDANLCLGRTHGLAPAEPKKFAAYWACGSRKWNTTVYLSGVSRRVISSKPSCVFSLLPESRTTSTENRTSSLVNGTPSD